MAAGECYILSFISGKGGTGKTTITANFAAEFASSIHHAETDRKQGRKNRVLVIDNDYATGGASYLLAGGERLKSGAEADLIIAESCFYDCYTEGISPTRAKPLRLVFEAPRVGEYRVDVMLNSLDWWKPPEQPENPDGAAENAEAGAEGEEILTDEAEIAPEPTPEKLAFSDTKLLDYYQQLLSRFRNEYDYILIDCRGGAETRASLAALLADSVVVVTEPGDIAYKQDETLFRSLYQLSQKLKIPLENVSLLYNRVLRSDEVVQVEGEFPIAGTLPLSEAVVNCYRNSQLIFEHKPFDRFSKQALSTIHEFFPHCKGIGYHSRFTAKAFGLMSPFLRFSNGVLGIALGVLVFILSMGLGFAPALIWILPLTIFAASCTLGFTLLLQSIKKHPDQEYIYWLVGGALVLLLGTVASVSSSKAVPKIQGVVQTIETSE